MRTILLVDDNNTSRLTTKWFFSHLGYLVHAARSAEEALSVFNPGVHDVVVTDNSMPGMSGIELAHVVKMRSRSTPVLMYTGKVPEDQSMVDAVITRDSHLLVVRDTVERLLNQRESAG